MPVSPELSTTSPDALLPALAARSVAQMAGENFPVALRVLPRRVRDELTRVYAFARFVDDVGDEAPGDRLALLDQVAGEVRAVWAGRSSRLRPVEGLRPLIAPHAMPVQPFLDLIEANRVDQRRSTYETFDELLDYCRLSAAPIGRMVLHIADAATEQNIADSDLVCNALQVLEHCQDVGEDARAGRIYLPQQDLRSVGVTTEELTGSTTSPAVRAVVTQQVTRAQRLLTQGAPLVRRLSGWSRLAVAGYLAGGDATVIALREARYDVLDSLIKPGRARTVACLLRRMAGR